jgi:NAD dependent epimerase/dehydratase
MAWNNTKIVITGASGFIGSHLTEELVKKGARVKALVQYNSFNNWGWLENLDCISDIEVVMGDVRDPYYCQQLLKGSEVVFHLASLIAIPYSYVAPDSYIDTNVKGTLNICQAALNNGCNKVIHTSTSEVYGTAQYVPIDEKHPLQPQSPYSASKIGADSIAMSFYNAFNLPISIARPFNTYGPRQSLRAVIPNIIAQIQNGSKKIKIGDLIPKRDFNFVKDTCAGLISIAEIQGNLGQVFNIGSGKEISIGDLFQLIKELMNSKVEVEVEKQRIRPEKSEVQRLCCDNSKLKKITGFSPKHTLKEGLQETIEWFGNPVNLQKYKTNIYNV